MKTLLSRSITAPAAIIAVTLATPTVAKEADIESLVAAAQKEGRFTVWVCLTVGQTGKTLGLI